jgi:hypothetical protein
MAFIASKKFFSEVMLSPKTIFGHFRKWSRNDDIKEGYLLDYLLYKQRYVIERTNA